MPDLICGHGTESKLDGAADHGMCADGGQMRPVQDKRPWLKAEPATQQHGESDGGDGSNHGKQRCQSKCIPKKIAPARKMMTGRAGGKNDPGRWNVGKGDDAVWQMRDACSFGNVLFKCLFQDFFD